VSEAGEGAAVPSPGTTALSLAQACTRPLPARASLRSARATLSRKRERGRWSKRERGAGASGSGQVGANARGDVGANGRQKFPLSGKREK
jgi:hypothetical protein